MISLTIRLDIHMIFLETVRKVKVDSYAFLPQEKTLSLDNVLILIKSVCNKYRNHYCYNMFLERKIINDLKATIINKVLCKL